MSAGAATAYRSRFAGRFMPSEKRKSPQNSLEIKPFYGYQDTHLGNAHCIKDSVLLDETCGSGGLLPASE